MADEPQSPAKGISEPPWPTQDPAQTYLHFPLQPHDLSHEITPVRDLFVLAHLGVPRVDPESWSLSIGGMVDRPLRLRLAELKALPQRSVQAFLQCAGNPVTPKVPARLIANVMWRGVDLGTLLDAAGVAPQARFVWTYGLEVAPESVIVSPSPGSEFSLATAQPVTVSGWAWGNAGICRVDVSFEGGRSWCRSRLEPVCAHAWQRFTIDWTPRTPGKIELQCRATDTAGRSQPASDARNAIHTVTVSVHE